MIEAKSNDGKIKVTVSGTLMDLMTDFVVITQGVVDAIEEVDEDSAKLFCEWLVEDFIKVLFLCNTDTSKLSEDLLSIINKCLDDLLEEA